MRVQFSNMKTMPIEIKVSDQMKFEGFNMKTRSIQKMITIYVGKHPAGLICSSSLYGRKDKPLWYVCPHGEWNLRDDFEPTEDLGELKDKICNRFEGLPME